MLKPIDVDALGADDDLQIIGTKTYTYSIKDIVDVLLNATILYSSTIKDIVDILKPIIIKALRTNNS